MEALFSAIAGFSLFHFTTHPKSKLYKKLPRKKLVNRIQVFPSIHFEAKNRVFHFHHWMIFSSFYFFAQQSSKPILHSDLLQGFLIGAIIQGLLFADRFRVVFKESEYHKKVKRSSYNISFLKKLV